MDTLRNVQSSNIASEITAFNAPRNTDSLADQELDERLTTLEAKLDVLAQVNLMLALLPPQPQPMMTPQQGVEQIQRQAVLDFIRAGAVATFDDLDNGVFLSNDPDQALQNDSDSRIDGDIDELSSDPQWVAEHPDVDNSFIQPQKQVDDPDMDDLELQVRQQQNLSPAVPLVYV